MDIVELLTRDHREVGQLFGRFRRSSKPETRKELARKIVRELSVHAAVEEQFVYPVARVKVDGGSGLADHSIDEHQQVKELLSRMEQTDPASAEMTSLMDKLVDAVREHVAEEERGLLRGLGSATDADFRSTLGSVVERAKSVVPTHPHPLVPGTAAAQLVAGPWASLVDHVRDLVA